jgi:hypothetical protein
MYDEEGLELADLNAIQEEALQSSADMIKGLDGQHLWNGTPWKLWVTDQPKGEGNTLLILEFSARHSYPSFEPRNSLAVFCAAIKSAWKIPEIWGGTGLRR